MANQILHINISAPILSVYNATTITAYLLPLLHLRIRLPPDLKYRIPPKIRWPPCRHDLPLGPPLEEDRLLAWPGTERKGADRYGGFVGVGGEEVVEARMA